MKKIFVIILIIYSSCQFNNPNDCYEDLNIFKMEGIEKNKFNGNICIEKDEAQNVISVTFYNRFKKKKLKHIRENIYSSKDEIFSRCRISTSPIDSILLYTINDTLYYIVELKGMGGNYIEFFTIYKLNENEIILTEEIIEKKLHINEDMFSFISNYQFDLKNKYGYQKYTLNMNTKKIHRKSFTKENNMFVLVDEDFLRYSGNYYSDILVNPKYIGRMFK